jgi:hypothetical protein
VWDGPVIRSLRELARRLSDLLCVFRRMGRGQVFHPVVGFSIFRQMPGQREIPHANERLSRNLYSVRVSATGPFRSRMRVEWANSETVVALRGGNSSPDPRGRLRIRPGQDAGAPSGQSATCLGGGSREGRILNSPREKSPGWCRLCDGIIRVVRKAVLVFYQSG